MKATLVKRFKLLNGKILFVEGSKEKVLDSIDLRPYARLIPEAYQRILFYKGCFAFLVDKACTFRDRDERWEEMKELKKTLKSAHY